MSALLTTPKLVWITKNCGIFLKRRNTRPPDLPPEKSVCRSRRRVRTGHGTTDWFQIGKEDINAVYSQSAYLTYMQSTS